MRIYAHLIAGDVMLLSTDGKVMMRICIFNRILFRLLYNMCQLCVLIYKVASSLYVPLIGKRIM